MPLILFQYIAIYYIIHILNIYSIKYIIIKLYIYFLSNRKQNFIYLFEFNVNLYW